MTAALNTVPVARAVVADGMFTLAGRALRTIFVLALSIIVARMLGPHDRGLYALPTVVYVGLVVSLLGGVADAVSYFMLNAGAGRAILVPALLTGMVFIAFGSISVVVFAKADHNMWALPAALSLLPFNLPVMILTGYAAGTKRIRWQALYALMFSFALLCAIAFAFAVFGGTLRVAIGAFIAVSAITSVFCLLLVVRDSRTLPARRVPLPLFMAYAVRVGIVNVVTMLNYRSDLYIIALLTTPAVLGQYAVAVGAAEALLVVTQIPATVSSPHVGSLPTKDAAALTATCARMTFLLAVLLCGTLYAFAPVLIPLVYGHAYAPLVPALRILLVAVMILSLARPVSNYFTLKTGTPEVGLASALCAAVLCIGLSLVLVPRMGMLGGAIATTCAYLAGESIRIAVFTRKARISLWQVLVPTRRDLHSSFAAAKDTLTRSHTGALARVSLFTSRKYAALLLVFLVSIPLSAFRVHQAIPQWTNDGAIYLAMTLRDRGLPKSVAYARADEFMLTTTQGRSHPEFYTGNPPRFIITQRDLFLNRPLYPLLASLIPVKATLALKLVSGLAYALIPPLIFIAVLTFTQPWVALIAAIGAAAIPSVYEHAGLALTDELALFLWVAAFCAMLAYARSPSVLLYGVSIAAMAALLLTRPAVPLIVGAAFGTAVAVRDVGKRIVPYALFGALAVLVAAFSGYTAAVHGATLNSELHANYEWQRTIHGQFTSHGFGAWRALVAVRAILLLPKVVFANVGMFSLVLAGIGIIVYRGSVLTAMALGAFLAACATALLASPLDVERTVTMPVLPILVILAALGLGSLVRLKAQTAGPRFPPSFH